MCRLQHKQREAAKSGKLIAVIFFWKGDGAMVKVNGNELAIAGMTIAEHLALTDFDLKRVVVERNGEIVPKVQYSETVLADGDIIEIVSFVGGG